MKLKRLPGDVKVLADIASRGGKVPPLYLYVVYVFPGFVYSIIESGYIRYIPFLLISIAILPLMAATNLFDDFFDYKRGIDRGDSPNTAYRHHPIFYFKVKENYLLFWAAILSLIYFAFLAVISMFYGIAVFIVGLFGWVLGYGYTGWPIGYKYRGLGEIGVFLSSLLVNSLVVIAITKVFNLGALIFFLPFSTLIILILFVGNYRDKNYDYAVGLKTLAHRLGDKGSKFFVSGIFALYYILITIANALGVYPKLSLVALATIPFAYNVSSGWHRKNKEHYESYLGLYILPILSLLIALLMINLFIPK